MLIFSPTGWDNEKKISILFESMTSMKPDDPFEDAIVKPVLRKVKHILYLTLLCIAGMYTLVPQKHVLYSPTVLLTHHKSITLI